MVVKEGDSLSEAVKSSAFKFVMFVLRALAANDERIIEEFRSISQGKLLHGKQIVNFDFAEVLPMKIESEKFVQSIRLQAWGKLAQLSPMSYAEACDLVRKLGLRNQKHWRAWRAGKRPDLPPVPADNPGNPNEVYRGKGWVSWGEFFGTGYVSAKLQTWKSFVEAREIVRSLRLNTQREWDLWRQNKLPEKGLRPHGVPAFPAEFYATEWVSWNDWIGKPERPKWWPFEQARAWVHKLELWRLRPQGGGQLSWKDYCVNKFPNLPKRPKDCIPTAPDKVYVKSGWNGFQDWVGNPHAHPKPSIET
jgi:hypothetical protein